MKKHRREVNKRVKKVLENFPGKVIRVENPPGTITKELWAAAKSSLKTPSDVKILVEGEEDLSVAPFIIEGDSDTVIFYGMKDTGFVLVEINKEIKDKTKNLLKKLEGR